MTTPSNSGTRCWDDLSDDELTRLVAEAVDPYRNRPLPPPVTAADIIRRVEQRHAARRRRLRAWLLLPGIARWLMRQHPAPHDPVASLDHAGDRR